MPSMLEALKQAGLADAKKAEQIERKEKAELRKREQMAENGALFLGVLDELDAAKERRYHAQAAMESRQPTSNRNSKAYLKRFMR